MSFSDRGAVEMLTDVFVPLKWWYGKIQTLHTSTIPLLYSDGNLCGFNSILIFFFPKEEKNVKISVLAGVDEKAAEGH